MTKRTISAICAFFVVAAVTIGLNISPSAAEVEAFTKTEAYKAQEAAHFARLARMEAKR